MSSENIQQNITAKNGSTISGVNQTTDIKIYREPELRVAEGWLRWSYRLVREFVSDTFFRSHYIKLYQQRLEKIIDSIEVIHREKPFKLEEIYIGLRTIDYAPRNMTPDSKTKVGRSSKTLYIEQALTLGQDLVILGDPGAGKTTLLKHLTLAIIRKDPKLMTFVEQLSLVSNGQNLEYPVPIFVTLNDYGRKNISLVDYTTELLEKRGFPYPGRFLRRKLEAGKVILLLDGLDEVTTESKKKEVIREIEGFVERYGFRNRVVVTSRVAGFRDQLRGSFIKLEIIEFRQPEVENFVSKWFLEHPDKERGLLEAFQKNHKMRSLASNPLLLSIIAVVYELDWSLPERRVDLYETCVNILCKTWDEYRHIDRPSKYREKWQPVLKQLAYHFFIQSPPKTIFSEEELSSALEIILPEYNIESTKTDVFIREVMEHTGLLRQKSRATFDFVHLTFQEYFTAKTIADSRQEILVIDHWNNPEWQEIIVLLSGIIRDAKPIIDYILGDGKPSLQKLILAARCLEDADNTKPETRESLTRWILPLLLHSDENLYYPGVKDVLALISEQQFQFLCKLVVSEKDPNILRRIANILGAWGNPNAIDPLLYLLNCANEEVLETVAIAFSKIGKLSLEPLVLALENEEASVRQSAALALGELGNAEAIPVLLRVLQSTGLPEVRGQAAIALGDIGDRTDTIRGTLESYLHHYDPTMRYAAVCALKRLSDNRSVGAILRVLRDTNEIVATTAVEIFQDLGDSAIFALKQQMKNDEDELREAACLALSYINSPETNPLIMEAMCDKSSYVRAIAAIFVGKNGVPLSDLKKLLLNDQAEVRLAATIALRYGKDTTVTPPLKNMVDDTDPGVRASVIVALNILDQENLVTILENLHEPKLVIDTLTKLKEISVSDAVYLLLALISRRYSILLKEAETALINLCKDLNREASLLDLTGPRLNVPLVVHWRLSEFKEDVFPFLVEFIKIGDPFITRALTHAIFELNHEYFGGTRVLKTLIAYSPTEIRREILFELREHKFLFKDFLIRALSRPEPKLREDAALALGDWMVNRAVVPLTKVISDIDPFVRVAAIKALGKLDNKQAVEPLVRQLLRDENYEVRLAIIKVLAKLGDARALDPLRMIEEKDERLARVARDAIKKLGSAKKIGIF